ncbi:MAG: tetratricopeptide repeat protein [Treponema sp.]|nr:tetratricopeptide repeat protein [Treponema sp.]
MKKHESPKMDFFRFSKILAGIFFVCLCGCKSTRIYVPGEKKTIIENIYGEYYAIADEYFKMKNYSKAAEFYTKASSSENLHNAAYFNAARSFALAKNWDEAKKIYLEIEAADGENSEVKQGLAYIYAMNGEFEKAESLYENLLEANPNVSEVLVNYTVLLLTQEKYDKAESCLAQIKEKFPDEKKIKSIQEKIDSWKEQNSSDDGADIPDELKSM